MTLRIYDIASNPLPSTTSSHPPEAGPADRCAVAQWVWKRKVAEKILTDNAAALGAIRAGYSRKPAYMRRTQKVALGLLADYAADPNSSVGPVATLENLADIFTKGLDSAHFWKPVRYLGLH